MLRSSRFLLALLMAVLALGNLYAQSADISIPAWIDEGDCGPAPKFEASLNGKPSPVVSEKGPGSDQVILLVVDLTGDVVEVDAAKQALVTAISKLDSHTWVGLLRCQDGLHVLADPSANRQALLDTIKGLVSTGAPGFYETVTQALSVANGMMNKSPVRVSVLYVTDGIVYNYREDYTNPVINQSDPHDLSRVFPDALIRDKTSRLLDDADALQAPLFIVQLVYRGDTLSLAYQNSLIRLTEATGGMGVVCRSVGEIPDAINAEFARISKAWRLTLQIPAKTHSAQIHLRVPCNGEEGKLSWRAHLRPKEG